MNSSKQIKLGAILSYTSIGVNILAGLLYTPWMISQIGKSEYGLFTLANSLITMFMVDFGLGFAITRYVSKYKAENAQEKIDNFLGAIYRLYLLVDMVIFVVLLIVFFFLDDIYVKLTVTELEKFKTVYIIVAIYSLISFPFVTLNGILTAYEKFIQLKLADLLYRALVVVLMVVALLNGFGLYALVTVNAIVGLLVIIYKLIIIQKQTSVKVNFKYYDRSLYKDVFGFSIWVTINTLAQRLIFNITPSILGIVADSAAIAVFGIVVTIEGYTYTIASAISGMFMPMVSRMYSNKDSQSNITGLMIKVGRYQYALNGLIVVGFAIIGKSFINLWMGVDYAAAYYGILLVIIPGLFFNSLEIANTAMVVQKKVNLQAGISVISGVLNVCLSSVLSKKYGVIGACLSIFVAYMLRSVLYNIAYHKVLKFDIFLFIKQCYLKMSLPILITLFMGFVLNYIFSFAGWFAIVLKALFVIMIYLISVFFMGLSVEERTKIYKIIKR